MSKFDKVKKALEESTKGSSNFVTLTKNVNAGHNGKYATQNVVTRNVSTTSYKTLDEVIKEYNLEV